MLLLLVSGVGEITKRACGRYDNRKNEEVAERPHGAVVKKGLQFQPNLYNIDR